MQQQQHNGSRSGWNAEEMRAAQNKRRDTGVSLTSSTRFTCLTSLNTGGQRPSHPLQLQGDQHDQNNRYNTTPANNAHADTGATRPTVTEAIGSKTAPKDVDLEHTTCAGFRDNMTRFSKTRANAVHTATTNDEFLSNGRIPCGDYGTDSGSVDEDVDSQSGSVAGDEVGRFYISSTSEYSELIPHHDERCVASNTTNAHALVTRNRRQHTRCTSL